MPDINRRGFVKSMGTVAGAATLGSACAGTGTKNRVAAAAAKTTANDVPRAAIIGVGGRGSFLLRKFLEIQEQDKTIEIVCVCDVYQQRLNSAMQKANCEGTLDWREVVDREDIDAVIIATPDHWHATIAMTAMQKGKDVYCEKPMAHTVDEARQMAEMSVKLGRITQVGSQTTSADQWWKARKYIAEGAIGKLLLSQGSYHRNSTGGEWNYRIHPETGPQGKGEKYIDWKMWLGPAEEHEWNPDRFFRFRKYWDYSGGTATDLFFHVMAPLNLCWGEAQFPYRVVGMGGNYVFTDEREVPDTFMLSADYPNQHSVVLTSSMANRTHIPGLIRGHEGTIVMVDHGRFEGHTDHITIKAEKEFEDKFVGKYGKKELEIGLDPREEHYRNWVRCLKTREQTVLPFYVGYRVQVPITLAVLSYREGRMKFFDPVREKVTNKNPLA